jgi:hypothetical protein
MTYVFPSSDLTTSAVVKETRAWLEGLVIGESLCPFAKKPFDEGSIRIEVCQAKGPEELLQAFEDELKTLLSRPRTEVETTLLVHPWVLCDFMNYNAFLDVVDDCIVARELEGVVQVATFHPDYQFAGSEPTDISNATNRSPFPMLHLLREESITEALEQYEGDPALIPLRNMKLLLELGWDGLAKKIDGEP